MDNTLSELYDMWLDQEEFNQNFFPRPESYPEQSRQTKEMLIHLMSEMDELLRCTEWKPHRKVNVQPNMEQVKNELTDMFKYFISLCLIWGVSPKQLMEDYWRKSMVCRQRYSEEFCTQLEGDIALVDIDGVLADYHLGISRWIQKHYPELYNNVEVCIDNNIWIDSDGLQINDQRWQEIKHRFRTSRGKVYLPLCPNAKEFLDELKASGLKVVLLTSRPIDQYPNLYMDTLEWLRKNNLQFDYLWWAVDKKEAILSKNIRNNIRFAIDDDPKYIGPYSRMGIKCFWVDWMNPKHKGVDIPRGVKRVRNLAEVIGHLKVKETV